MNTKYFAASAALAGILVAPQAAALQIYLAEDASYRYVNATAQTDIGTVPANWFAPGFDDSNWFTGQAPFASGPGTFQNLSNSGAPYAPDPQPTFGSFTTWAVPSDPYLRTTFTLAGPTPLTLWLAVDNGVNSLYLNGVLATAPVNAEGAAFRWEHVFDIPAAYTFAGTNTLALQLEDHGGATGYALVITADDSAIRDPITDNPPPTPPSNDLPEPATFLLLALGFLAFGVFRREEHAKRARTLVLPH